MSRSNYSDDLDWWDLIRWRGAVQAALCGARGQRALREVLAALDAMPTKVLITQKLEQHGEYCVLGVLGKARDLAMDEIDPEDATQVAHCFELAPAFVRELAYRNDEGAGSRETPQQRWQRMRAWVEANLYPLSPPHAGEQD